MNALMETAVPVTATWYVRCSECLAIATVQGPRGAYFGTAPDCADCQRPLEVLGRVKGQSLIHGTRCPCDDRCTGAKGPHCSCSCGGKNHGAGLSKDIEHIAGSVPVVRLATRKDVARAASIRARIEALRSTISADPTYQSKLHGQYVQDFGRYLDVRDRIGRVNSIMSLKSHSGREKALARIEAER